MTIDTVRVQASLMRPAFPHRGSGGDKNFVAHYRSVTKISVPIEPIFTAVALRVEISGLQFLARRDRNDPRDGEGGRRNGRHVGICAQAPSDYPEVARFLVEIGIDSICLNPDTFIKTIRHVLEMELRLDRAPRAQMGSRASGGEWGHGHYSMIAGAQAE